MNSDDFVFTPPIKKFKFSANLKIVLIGILIFILMIPFTMINSLISERETRQKDAINEISDKWGHEQTISGPIISIPYNTYYYSEGKRKFNQKQIAHFLPEDLNIKGNIKPEIRNRGIYEAILYSTDLNITGYFKKPSFKKWSINENDICWNEARITFGISDLRGIKNSVVLKLNNSTVDLVPGTTMNELEEGIHSPITFTTDTNVSQKIQFNAKIEINGSKKLNFLPVGKETKIELSSPWPNPSFQGNYLPEDREISEKGFTAKWKISHFNRNFPQQWRNDKVNINKSSFGLELLKPIDEYCKINRTTKYALLFITLTFLTFFLIEILNKLRVHPIQYLLIGFALCLFYTLLLSLSEHFSFNIAYIVSSIAITTLISLYTKAVLQKTKLSFIIGTLITTLYSFLYVVLQQQDYSLLMGSVGLFIILSIVMFVTRKIDWYGIGNENRTVKGISE